MADSHADELLPDSAAALELGRLSNTGQRSRPRIGRYEVLSRLGRGGMGTVYLVRLRGEGGFSRPFALKVLRSHLARDAEALRSLHAEARIASRLNHPNVVSVVNVGSSGDQPYVVMEYVQGPNLADLLAANSPQAYPKRIVTLIVDALAGLSAVHSAVDADGTPLRIIHHDISPNNFLVGTDGVCRLTDFGIAAIRSSSGNPSERGKPAYMSPERIEALAVDTRSDIFSMGVLMWTALTGARLFEGDDVQRTLKNVLTSSVPPPSAVSGSPACLDAICLKALSRRREDRFESALEMANELRQVAIAHDLLDSPAGVADWVRDVVGDSADALLERNSDGAGQSAVAAELLPPESAAPKESELRSASCFITKTPNAASPLRLSSILKLLVVLLAVAALVVAVFAQR